MQSHDYTWFINHLPSLYEKYGDVYLAIKDEAVIGIFKSYADGVNETKKSEPLGTFIVQRCGRDESAYTNYISSFSFTLQIS